MRSLEVSVANIVYLHSWNDFYVDLYVVFSKVPYTI